MHIKSTIVLAAASASATLHQILVGDGGNTYNPNNIKAAEGDIVEFAFMGGNHSVVQSNFQNPCTPLGNLEGTETIFSGFQPSSANPSGEVMTFNMTVPSTDPLWFYCAQANHCQGGMVFAVNPNTTGSNTFDNYKKASSEAPSNIAPNFSPNGGEVGLVSSKTIGKAGSQGINSNDAGVTEISLALTIGAILFSVMVL